MSMIRNRCGHFLFLLLCTTFHLAHCANPIASDYFKVIGCDHVELDPLIVQAREMAKAAANVIDDLLNGPILPQTPRALRLRLAALIWGIDTEDSENGGDSWEITQTSANHLKKIADRYLGVAGALVKPGGKNYFTPGDHYIFCDESSLIKANSLGDWVEWGATVSQEDIIRNKLDQTYYYYPQAGFGESGVANIVQRGRECTNENGQPSTIGAYTSKIPPVLLPDGQQPRGTYMILCPSFYSYADPLINPNTIPEEAWDLRAYATRSDILLHEVFHQRFSDIVDIKANLFEDTTTAEPAYGVLACSNLAVSTKPGCGIEFAMLNADNYRWFALGAWLPTRAWDFGKMIDNQ